MRATLTLLWDSLQLLRARKLFWIAMGISIFVALIYASVGFHETGWSIGFGLKKFEDTLLVSGSELSKMFYLLIFSSIISPFWLGFVVVLLGLMTSCSVFPEMMKEGAIETIVSKPVSRWQVFFVKYLGMLGFMALPLTLFCIIIFLALGIRGDSWKPQIFWAIPLLTFTFSILYSFTVFIGVWTRSTLFALLATMIFRGSTWLVHLTESMFYKAAIQPANAGIEVDWASGGVAETGVAREPDTGVVKVYKGLRKATWIMPKPRKTTLLLKRFLVFDEELGPFAGVTLSAILAGSPEQGLGREAQEKSDLRMGLTEILLPSALFQILMLGIAGLIFARKDF